MSGRTRAAGRLPVLRGFLERTAIFRTPYFYDRLENQACENLAEAVRRLETQAAQRTRR